MVEGEWDRMAAAQDGAISRRQLLAAGWTAPQLRSQLRSGRWQKAHPGVYVTFTGPLPPRTRLWTALLSAGPGAVAGPRSSLWLLGLAGLPLPIDVDIPGGRLVRRGDRALPGVRRRDVERSHQPGSWPPRLRIEEAVLDVAGQTTAPEQVVDLVLKVTQSRRTTAHRLTACLDRRHAHRWRPLLTEVLAQVQDGVQSPLERRWVLDVERRWVLDVERRHGLPAGRLNHREVTQGRSRYRDVAYDWGLVCELDGREAHPDDEQFRERARDNAVTVEGRATLRYGWREVAGDPCGVATEVTAVLARLGWPGTPRPCGPRCSIDAAGRHRSNK